MDATTHSSRPDHDSARIFDEKLSEKQLAGFGLSNTSTNHLSVDTRPATLRNGASDSQAIAARTPDRQTVGEFAQSQHFTLRTLPGIFPVSPLIVYDSASLIVFLHSLDPIS